VDAVKIAERGDARRIEQSGELWRLRWVTRAVIDQLALKVGIWVGRITAQVQVFIAVLVRRAHGIILIKLIGGAAAVLSGRSRRFGLWFSLWWRGFLLGLRLWRRPRRLLYAFFVVSPASTK
jgi:hypothetical protein